MLNILFPSMGDSVFFKESYYPKLLLEIDGKPMVQRVIENYETVKNKNIIFVFGQAECNQFHTDEVVKILTNNKSNIIRLKGSTQGALCTSLMAVNLINNDEPLIIANNDQIISEDLNKIVDFFHEKDSDCGVVCFNNVHPRWSYIRTEEDLVVEVAEKRPLSNKAIAGIYYFKHGSDFVLAAKNAIKKGSCYEGKFYISSAINEIILMNKTVNYYNINKEQYHSFYSPEKIKEYEKNVKVNHES